jgi:hypothetical protein
LPASLRFSVDFLLRGMVLLLVRIYGVGWLGRERIRSDAAHVHPFDEP